MSYLLDNKSELANERFRHLETLFDGRSLELITKYLGDSQVVWLPGAGSGSLANHIPLLKDGVTVHVTDMDPRWFSGCEGPGINAYVHDLLDPEPYPQSDLIHARLVLQHVPGWKTKVLPRLVESLNPGGVLIVEELDPITPYLPGAQTEDEKIVNAIGDGFTQLLGERGADYSNGSQMIGTLQKAGLVVEEAFGYQASGHHRNAAIRLQQTNARQTKDDLVGLSIPAEDVDRYVEYLETDEAWLHLPVMYSVVARKGKN